jgi:outer membrane lipoprotein-sorting protein
MSEQNMKLSKLFLITIPLLISTNSYSVTAEQKGLKIATEMEKANNGFIGEKSSMEMLLIDAYGAKTTRKMNGFTMEMKGDGDRTLMSFNNPKDVKGTKMLTWSHKTKDDSQWLYLPSLRRVKKISSRNKTGSFMGSEFSFEDLGSQELEKYTYKFIKEAKTKKHKLWVLERKSVKKSGYSKQIMYVIKDYHNPLKIEYYDRKGELLKVGYFKNYKSFKLKGKTFYRASSIHMKNRQTKKESIFSWSNRKLGIKNKTSLFEKRSLK